MSLQPDFPQEGKEYGLFHNYARILSDKNFYKALLNNFKYSFSTIAVVLTFSIFLSFILNNIKNEKLRYLYLFCLLLPGLIPPSMMAILFNLTFNGKTGVLNQIFIIPLGFKHIDWMGNPSYVMTSLVMQAAWRWIGFITLFIMCGLESIPKYTKEAAIMEGAGKLKRYLSIELPIIRYILVFCAALLLVDTLSLFSGSYSILGDSGGPANAALVVSNYSYRYTTSLQYNSAATVSILILPLLLLLTALFCLKRKAA